MWRLARQTGPVFSKFALCNRTRIANASEIEMLSRESEGFGDLLFLDCEEDHDFLTAKLMACLQTFTEQLSNLDIFMKVDDNTFISWSRFYPVVSQAWFHHGGTIYMGLLVPPDEADRDPYSPTFEAWEAYPRTLWPTYAAGGPGYILGRNLLPDVLNAAESWLKMTGGRRMRNEDRAIGVFVGEAKNHSRNVTYIDVPASDGYEQRQTNCGIWSDYPLMLHHDLEGNSIACLTQVEAAGVPEATIDACFPDFPCSFSNNMKWWYTSHHDEGSDPINR
jgi:hypothetical protein